MDRTVESTSVTLEQSAPNGTAGPFVLIQRRFANGDIDNEWLPVAVARRLRDALDWATE